MKKKLLTIATLAAVSATAHAADTSSVPTLSQVLGASDINVTGYFDAAYSTMNTTGLFNNAGTGSIVGGMSGNSHIFDTQGATKAKNFSAFNLHQAAITVSKQPKEGFGGVVNVTAGQDAATIASAGAGAPATATDSTHTFDLTQAYVSYASGPLTVIGGKFATLAGAELITSPSNSNYTRAWMFGWGPYTHTGARATYVASDMVTLIAGINNGFDQVNSSSSGKTGEFAIDITPSSMFSLATTYYTGKGMISGSTGKGSYLDVLGTINATDKLNFVFDYANASQDGVTILPSNTTGKAKWNALALYANYHFSDQWRISYRHEGFDDKQGYRSGLVQKLNSHTITVGYAPTKGFELRGEVRQDKSNQAAFLKANGTTTDKQMTYALEGVYQF